MCKVLFFTDSHIRDFGSFPAFNRVEDNGLTRELNNILLGFQFVADKIDEVKPQVVIMPGDVFHSPETISVTALHASSLAFRLIQDACRRVKARFIIFPGNHDTQNENLKITSVANLSAYAEIKMEDTIIKVEHNGKTYKIGVLQYSSDVGHVVSTLRSFEKTCDFATTHMDFHNAMYDNGFKSESQIPSNYDIPVISGDIHTASNIGSVYFIGSLIQNRFSRSDTDYIGGVLVYDCDTKKISRYPNTYSTHYVKIEAPEQIAELGDTFRMVLQIKCEIEDKSILEGFEYVYIPINQNRNQSVTNPNYKTQVDSPLTMLRRFVTEHKPEAIDILESTLNEGSV